ncbi:MAG: aminodeoxychorismate lyase [Lysobacteraceae bacterium]
MTTRIYSGEYRVDALDPRDRGLAYGDGVFETILVHHGQPVWWGAHLARMQRGCDALGIVSPAPDFIRAEIDALIAGCRRGVLKIIVTRGTGEHGYAPPQHGAATLLLALADPPSPPPRDGLVLRWCETPLAIQPRLAGIKHLNRLEQVLARAEWNDPAIHDGLQCDTDGRVVCATSANLFVLRGGRWLTPPVVDCGIAGICREWILEHVTGAGEAVLARSDVESADGLILCNAVRGILPVAALGSRRWSPHPQVVALRKQLIASEPAFAPPEDA